jgi:RNA polymerase sigma factor (sigma-70 family)
LESVKKLFSYTKTGVIHIITNDENAEILKNYLVTEKEILEGCRKEDRKAQQALYDKYSPVLFGICRRYVRHYEDAEDVLIDAFFKIFKKIHQFKGNGSFEGWMKRIVVNEALMFLRRRHNFNMTVEINENLDITARARIEDDLAAQDILDLLNTLPTGYRTVFNLYVIEGYKHREIAEILDVSINTSKSQLILAKKRLQELLNKTRYPGVG